MSTNTAWVSSSRIRYTQISMPACGSPPTATQPSGGTRSIMACKGESISSGTDGDSSNTITSMVSGWEELLIYYLSPSLSIVFYFLCGDGYKNATTVIPAVRKRRQKGTVRGLGSLSSVYSPMKRQGTEGEEECLLKP